MTINNNPYKELLQVFVVKPTKEVIDFFKNCCKAISTSIKLFFTPDKVISSELTTTDKYLYSKTLFKLIFFCLIFKIAFNELDNNSQLTVVEQWISEFIFLVVYIIGLFFSLLLGDVWRKINSITEHRNKVPILFVSIFNLLILFSFSIFLFKFEMHAVLQGFLIFIIPFAILLRVKKIFSNKSIKNFLSAFIFACLFGFYFFLVSVTIDTVWNRNTVNIEAKK